ncbi:MAG TPA: GNAT family N-acetyltransferase [Gaiellaceae bacterium]|nr:GNAT family N-acetyltransferase [Gaiellaceae bacterium]
MEDVVVHRPTLDDAGGVASLIVARDRADFGEDDPMEFTGDELREWWAMEEPRLETDVWIALRDGEIVGYASARREGDVADLADESCVHPEARGLGIGSHLLDQAEHWGREHGLPRLHVHVVNEDGRRLVERRGHESIRFSWRMEIELTEAPRLPDPPAGVTIRDYRPGEDDEALHAMQQEAFSVHWEFTPSPLEDWLKWRHRRGDYHPALWRIAEENGEIAGAALCFGKDGFGWVLDLAVRPASRRAGLGLLLLQSGFVALRRRGHTRVGLEVDSENETGATRLYERAGMAVTRRYATYEKALA